MRPQVNRRRATGRTDSTPHPLNTTTDRACPAGRPTNAGRASRPRRLETFDLAAAALRRENTRVKAKRGGSTGDARRQTHDNAIRFDWTPGAVTLRDATRRDRYSRAGTPVTGRRGEGDWAGFPIGMLRMTIRSTRLLLGILQSSASDPLLHFLRPRSVLIFGALGLSVRGLLSSRRF